MKILPAWWVTDFSFLFLLDVKHQNKAQFNASMRSVLAALAGNKIQKHQKGAKTHESVI